MSDCTLYGNVMTVDKLVRDTAINYEKDKTESEISLLNGVTSALSRLIQSF